MKKIINILGAGPAGLTCAINLAKEGYRVNVYEKERDSGTRFHSNLQGLENWTTEKDARADLLEKNIDLDFFYKPYMRVDYLDPPYHRITTIVDKPLFYLLERGNQPGCLDNSLKSQALKNGVDIFFDKKMSVNQCDVIATGTSGCGALAVGYTFSTSVKDQIFCIFNDDIAPKGYAYLLICGGKGTMTTGMGKRKYFHNWKKYLQKAEGTFRRATDFDMHNKRFFSAVVNIQLRKKYVENNRMFIGEVAGIQDAFWGFGIRVAITSGYLAARAIIEGENYDSLVKKNLIQRFKASIVNRFVFEFLGNFGYKHILFKVFERNSRKAFRDLYRYSFFKKLAYPVAKIKAQNRIKKSYISPTVSGICFDD